MDECHMDDLELPICKDSHWISTVVILRCGSALTDKTKIIGFITADVLSQLTLIG